MNTPTNRPVIFDALSAAASNEVLVRNSLGRIAFTRHNRVDIEPLNYVAEGEWIYGRTSAGGKIATLAHQHWCAFEVDEVRSLFAWTSVVVQGTFHVLSEHEDLGDPYHHALALIRTLYAEALSDGDYAPHRTTLFRIYIDSITGRSASSGS